MNNTDSWSQIIDAFEGKKKIYVLIHSCRKGGWNVLYKNTRGFLPLSQLTFHYKQFPNDCIGKSFPCLVIDYTENSRNFVVSHKRFLYQQAKNSLLNSLSPKTIVTGIYKEELQDGIYVEINGLEFYIPQHELFDNFCKNTTIGQSVDIYIIKIDKVNQKLFLSIKRAEEIKSKILFNNLKKELLSGYKKGDLVSGTVKSFRAKNVIVDVNGCEGVVYVKNLAKQYVNNPQDFVKEEQTIEAVVLDINLEKFVLSLGVKQAQQLKIRKEKERIKEYASQFNPGDILEATVNSFNGKKVSVDFGGEYLGTILKEDLAGGRIPIDKKVFIGMQTKVVYLREDDGTMFFSTKLLEPEKYRPVLYEYPTDQLLSEIGIDNNSFVGKVTRIGQSGRMFLVHLFSEDNGRLLCDPYTGAAIPIIIDFKYHNLFLEDEYYRFRIKALTPKERRGKECPYLFELDNECLIDNTLTIVSDPYKKLVEQTFMKQTSPSSNASLANLLEEVGQNMYDSKERMFFELLQNADDASGEKGVQVKLESIDGYLLMTHNGLPFDRKDFVSITSAARSTKTGNKKKTGYKGIGFKSVFTNSTKVLLKTGGFFFTFNKDNPLFDDFDKYYLYVNNITEVEKQKEYIERFKDEKEEFKGVESIPWQLLPEWTEEIPDDLQTTIFSKNENVSIALAMADAVKTEYLESIRSVLNEPKFMLFLRHTNRITYKEGNDSFVLDKERRGETITLQTTLENHAKTQYFIVREADPIPVNTEYFKECGIDIVVESRFNNKTQKYENVFINGKGEKIASIPSRIAETSDTLISYAFAVESNDQYVRLNQSTTLFAYLPMTETRYPFPFYINADFILKSSREGVQSDNPWNFFIFYNIGKEYVKWIGKAASIKHPNYLSLLLTKLFDEETTGMKDLSKAFNSGYLKSLNEEPFIINDSGETVKMSEIVLDHTGISSTIGADNFCLLVGCEGKRLPSDKIDSKILNENIFSGIEHVDDVTDVLIDKKNRKYFRNWMQTASESELDSLLNWLNEHNNTELIKVLPLFSFNGRYLAIEELRDNYLFVDTNVITLIDLLKTMGFVCYDGDIMTNKLYTKYLENGILKGYASKNISAIINRSESLYQTLSTDDKVLLYSVISSLSRDIKLDNEFKSWRLFTNNNGEACRLDTLIKLSEDSTERALFAECIINDEEYEAAQELISNKLMSIDQFYPCYLYKNWNIIIHRWQELGIKNQWDSSKYAQIYSFTNKYYDAAKRAIDLEKSSGKDSIPLALSEISDQDWAFVWTGNSFKRQSEIYYNSSFSDSDLFDAVSKLIVKPLPEISLVGIFSNAPFRLKSENLLTQELKDEVSLTASEIKKILELCKSNKEKFFEKKVIEKKESTFIIRNLKTQEWQFYYKGADFASFILKNCRGAIRLPSSFEEHRNEEGIITSSTLFEKVFGSVDVKKMLSELLPIVLTESREVKNLLSTNIKSLTIDTEVFYRDSLYTQLFTMYAELFSKDEGCTTLRDSICIKDSEGKAIPLSAITMQGTVALGDYYYDLEDLHPGEEVSIQRNAHKVHAKMRQVGIKEEFLNALFNLDATISPNDIFKSLNTGAPLENGVQLAFMLSYIKENFLRTALIKIKRKDNTEHPINNTSWLIKDYSFVDNQYVLPVQYHNFLDKFPETEWERLPLGIKIKNDSEVFSFLKSTLTDIEKTDLLDYIFNQKGNRLIQPSDIENIKNHIGLKSEDIVISLIYALPSEKLPTIIQLWANKSSDRLKYLITTFKLADESSRIVQYRMYFSTGQISEFISFKAGDNKLQEKLCLWITTQNLTFDNRLYGNLRIILDDTHLKTAVDQKLLFSLIANDREPDLKINNFSIYKIDGQMPHYAYLPLNNNYVVYRFYKEDYMVISYNIFVNRAQWSKLDGILKDIVADKSNAFTADDYMLFAGKQKTVTEAEADEIKKENERLLSLLERNNIDVSTLDDEYGGISDEQKRAALEEAKQRVLEYLKAEGYDTSNFFDDGWTCINGVRDRSGIECPLVVRSYKDNTRFFVLNASDWAQLTKSENSMLWIVTRNGCQSISFLDLVRNTRDRITFSFSTSNFDRKERITALAEIMRYFKGIRFDFGSLVPTHISIIQKFNQPEKELREVLKGDDFNSLPS